MEMAEVCKTCNESRWRTQDRYEWWKRVCAYASWGVESEGMLIMLANLQTHKGLMMTVYNF